MIIAKEKMEKSVTESFISKMVMPRPNPVSWVPITEAIWPPRMAKKTQVRLVVWLSLMVPHPVGVLVAVGPHP